MKTLYRVEAGIAYKNNESSDYEMFDLTEELTINNNVDAGMSYVRFVNYEASENFGSYDA